MIIDISQYVPFLKNADPTSFPWYCSQHNDLIDLKMETIIIKTYLLNISLHKEPSHNFLEQFRCTHRQNRISFIISVQVVNVIETNRKKNQLSLEM